MICGFNLYVSWTETVTVFWQIILGWIHLHLLVFPFVYQFNSRIVAQEDDFFLRSKQLFQAFHVSLGP